MLFFIHCVFDPKRVGRVQELRDSHLAYIGQHRSKITYGGLLQTPDGELDGICYFLDAAGAEAARQFALTDPYATIFEHVAAQRFEQRIPAPETVPTDGKQSE